MPKIYINSLLILRMKSLLFVPILIFTLIFNHVKMNPCTICRKECGCTHFTCPQPDYKPKKDFRRGLANGRTTDPPLVDLEFIAFEESDCACTYIPIDNQCNPIGSSSITIGAGIDLHWWTADNMKSWGVRNSTIQKLKPLMGIKSSEVIEFCKQDNFRKCDVELTVEERVELNTKFLAVNSKQLQKNYNADKEKMRPKGLQFEKLRLGVRTALYSLCHQKGLGGCRSLPVWKNLVNEEWKNAISWFNNSHNEQRRKDEGILIEYAMKDGCSSSYGDLVYNLDASGSIGASNFEKAKEFLENLSKNISISEKEVQVAIVVFSSDVKRYLDLSGDKNRVLSTIKSIHYDAGSTCTGDSLREVYNILRNSARKDIPRDMVIVTDGESNCGEPIGPVMQLIRALGVNSYALGVGDQINEDELLLIAGKKDNIYYVDGYNALDRVLEAIKADVCYSSKPIKPNENVEVHGSKGEVRYFNSPVDVTAGATVVLKAKTSTFSHLNLLGISSATPLKVYYSTTVDNPNEDLKDGIAVQISDSELAFSIAGNVNTTEVYYTTDLLENFDFAIQVQPSSKKLKDCIPDCIKCDLNGQNCEECKPGTTLWNGICESQGLSIALLFCIVFLATAAFIGIGIAIAAFCVAKSNKRFKYQMVFMN